VSAPPPARGEPVSVSRLSSASPRVQPSFDAEEKEEKSLLDMFAKITSQPKLFKEIEESKPFKVVLIVSQAPQQLRGVSGLTQAKLFEKDKKEPILTLKDSTSTSAASSEILQKVERMEVEVFLFTEETAFGSGKVVATNDAGKAMALVHEFERHVYRFYDLFLETLVASLSASYGETTQMEKLTKELGTGKRYNAVAQHLDPELAARTAIGIVGLAETSDSKTADDLLLRLYLDTIERGVAFNDLEKAYGQAGGKDTVGWKAFKSLAGELAKAVWGKKQKDYQPKSGEKIIVIDGAFRGRRGTVSPDKVPTKEKESATDLLVDVDKKLVQTGLEYLCLLP
jgi:hypothetical protein